MKILRISFEDSQGNGPIVILKQPDSMTSEEAIGAAKKAVLEEVGMTEEDLGEFPKPVVLDITEQDILSVRFESDC